MLPNIICLENSIVLEKETENSSTLKRDYNKIIEKLKVLHSNFKLKTEILDRKLSQWQDDKKLLNEIIKQNGQQVIQINIGGKIFMTKLSTLLNVDGSLFEKIILCQVYDKDEQIFIDRSPRMFIYILNYMRYRFVNFSNLSKKEMLDLKNEADYYGITQIVDTIDKIFQKN